MTWSTARSDLLQASSMRPVVHVAPGSAIIDLMTCVAPRLNRFGSPTRSA